MQILQNKLIEDIEKSLTKWLKKSGLKVNETKTELCLFYKNEIQPVEVWFAIKKLNQSQ
jgi:hypothetical protein